MRRFTVSGPSLPWWGWSPKSSSVSMRFRTGRQSSYDQPGLPKRLPAVEVVLHGTGDAHHVDGGAAAEDTTTQRVVLASVDLALRGVHDDVLGLEDGAVVAAPVGDDAGQRLRVGSRFQQQHLPVGVLGEPGRGHTPCRAPADHDHVVVAPLGHAASCLVVVLNYTAWNDTPVGGLYGTMRALPALALRAGAGRYSPARMARQRRRA